MDGQMPRGMYGRTDLNRNGNMGRLMARGKERRVNRWTDKGRGR